MMGALWGQRRRRASQRDRALAEGRCDERQAAAILTGLRVLDDPARAEQVLASLVTDPAEPGADHVLARELRGGLRPLWQVPPHQLGKIVAREAARLDPTTLKDRQRQARDGRRVDYVSGEGFGPASLVLTGPEAGVSHGHYSMAGDADGDLVITDRTGHTYSSSPQQYFDPG